MEHADLYEIALKSHAEKLRGHETDAQKFNGHGHPETTKGASLVRARALERVQKLGRNGMPLYILVAVSQFLLMNVEHDTP